MVLVEAREITKKIKNKTILQAFSLTVEENDFVVITGKSGAGKTTLISLLGLLEKPDTGTILYDGKAARSTREIMHLRREVIGFSFQNNLLLEHLTVKKNLDLGTKYVKNKKESTRMAMLRSLNLEERMLNEKVSSLSGGEQQRIALARTMLKNNQIIFADEPTGNLDDENAKIVMDRLIDWSREPKNSVVLVTHNKDFIAHATKHIEL